MTPEFKANLIKEIKANVITMIRDYNEVFTRFIDVMEKTTEADDQWNQIFERIQEEADEKASSPFQRFIVSYIIMKKAAMKTCIKFFERHDEWEKEELKKDKNIKDLEDYFMKKSKAMFEKMGQG